MEIGGVLSGVRPDFHEDAAHAVAAESVLEDDQRDEDQTRAQRDQRGGDEEAVALVGFREDKQVDGTDEDAEDDEHGDEDAIVEILGAEVVLQRPRALAVEVAVDGGGPDSNIVLLVDDGRWWRGRRESDRTGRFQ